MTDKRPDANDLLRTEGNDGVRRAFDEAVSNKSKRKRADQTKATDAGKHLEDRTALAFAKQHADDYRYVAANFRWMLWNGARWQPEKTLAAFDAARALCREAGDARAKIVAAVATLARTDRRIAATIEQFDADHDLLTAGAVAVDLKNGQERPPSRLDYCTKQASIAPAPAGTPCPLWTKFLNRVTADNDALIGFLKRYLGYCLTGHVNEHVFAFLYGTGANGKGTFLKTVGTILADYCAISPIEMFLRSKFDRHPTEVARLHKVRLTIAQETPKGKSWDEGKIKNLTGGDQLSGRFMRGDFFDFDPTHKIIIAGNNKPSLHSVDEAIRRRFLIVPFTVSIPAKERDPLLADKLKAEHPAILRWMIEGCLDWRRVGLVVPTIVRDASEDYFADQDLVEQWLADCVNVLDTLAFTPSRALFKSWKQWCDARNLNVGTEKALVEMIENKGYEHKRMEYGRGFKGLSLKNNDQVQTEADFA
jgi:putative DNA primase/helicase